MNAFYLTPFVLNEINMPKSQYFSYLDENIDRARACFNTICLDDEGGYINRQDDVFNTYSSDRKKIQYYYMFD
jgi:hypothetical protein